MRLRGVNAPRRHQPHHMGCPVVAFESFDHVDQNRILCKRTVFNRLVDFGKVLHNHTAGADVGVSDFRISHLPFGQSDRQAVGFNQAVRIVVVHPVPIRRMPHLNGIIRRLWAAIAPPVQNHQQYRFLCHSFFLHH